MIAVRKADQTPARHQNPGATVSELTWRTSIVRLESEFVSIWEERSHVFWDWVLGSG